MSLLQVGAMGTFLAFVILPGIALATAIALSVYEVYRIGERKLLIVIVILALMFQHQLLEAWTFLQTGASVAEGFGEVFETGANLIASGSVYYVLRFARRERRLVDELERSERQYRTLIDQAPVPVFLHGPDRIQYANEAAADMLDAPDRSAVTDRDLSALILDDESDPVAGTIVTDGGTDVIRTRVQTLDDETREVLLAVAPADYEGDDVAQVVAQDLTERKRRQREYEQIFNGVQDAISVMDPDTLEILDVNDAYLELFGYESLEAIQARGVEGLSVTEEGYTVEKGLAVHQRVAETGDPEVLQWQAESKSGERRWLEIKVAPAVIGGEQLNIVSHRDITERKRREQEFEQIFNGVHDAIGVWDPETYELVEINRRMSELTGYDREQLLETRNLVSVTEEGYDMDRARRRIDEVMAAEESLEWEWQIETVDGERRILEVRGTSAKIGGEDRVVTVSRDVTERRRREREYEQIFNGVQDAIVVHDPATGEMVDVNETFCDLMGYDKETILEMGTAGVSVTEEGYTQERAEEIIDKEGAGPFEWKVETSDGERRVFEVVTTTAEIGGELRHVSINRDITQRKRREHEYEQIFNGVNDIINVYDPETKTLVEVNDTLCELTGYDREYILEHGLDAISATDEGYTENRAADLITDVVESGEPRELEWCLVTADGDRRWLEVNATPATINGEQRVLTISRDVTERRRSERRLRAILDRIDDAILLTRAHDITSESRDPDFISSGYEEIWGHSLETIHERNEAGFFDTIHEDDLADYRRFVSNVVDDVDGDDANDRYSIEYRIRRPDETVRWVRSEFYPTDWASGPPRIVVVSRDVTDRKERERRIVSFEEATEDLTTADSPEEAARTAVEAATNSLDLSAVGTFLYDDEEGRLRPDVLSESLPDPRPVEPGDGPLWEAFATGTVVGGQDAAVHDDSPAGMASDLVDWRGIPLGNHGVLLVGSTERRLDTDTVQSAHVLGATLEAALNHLRGERQLASREEQLRTETRRAERLDRLARLTRRVEAAITESSDPGEVERAVCERLTDTYDVAWIGGVEVGTDTLTSRTVAGESSRYVTEMDLTTSSTEVDPHPAVEAWRTETVQTVDSLVSGGPETAWRQHLLSMGYQSVCAVPLTYDGITHGVLVVVSGSPDEFQERERETLEQLGTSVAHALAGIERRRALESDESVELEFQGTGVELSFAQLAREMGCRVRHERTVHREDGEVSVFFAFEGDVPPDAVEMADRHLYGSIDVVRDESDSMLVEVESTSWFGSPLAEYGAVLRRAEATTDGTTLVVELPVRSDVRAFTDRLQELAPSLELAAQRHHQRGDRTAAELRNQIERRLTDRQLETLRTAYRAGYFDWPRESDGSEVADQLDITQPTFNRHLRIAEQKTFEALLESES